MNFDRFDGKWQFQQHRSPINTPGKRIRIDYDDGSPSRVVVVQSSKVLGGGVEETTWKYEDTREIETRVVTFNFGE